MWLASASLQDVKQAFSAARTELSADEELTSPGGMSDDKEGITTPGSQRNVLMCASEKS